MKKISVVVPVYNTVKYLKQCLDSIVEQSYLDFQIILIDDGSTDGSGDLCDDYAEIDNRIKVIHQPNSGSVSARKAGLREAEGEYIYYVDSDDWLDKDVILSFMDIIEKHNVDMVLIGNKREYENGKCFIAALPFEDGYYDNQWIKNEMIHQLMKTDRFYENVQRLAYWNYLIKRELLVKNQKGIDNHIRMADDIVVIYPCLLDAKKLYIKKDVYYHYRQRTNSLKRTEAAGEYEGLKLVYRILVNRFLKEKEKDILLKQAKYLVLYCMLLSVSGKLHVADGIFPYSYFPKGSKVVVYGAGAFGYKIVEALIISEYAEIVAWVDENCFTQQYKGKVVDSLEKLTEVEFDYIILGGIIANIRQSMRISLKKYNVPIEKIIDIDITKIDNFSFPAEFSEAL